MAMPKLYVTLKTPGSLEDEIQEYVEREENECAQDPDMGDEERKNIRLNRIDEIKEICAKWFQYSETVTLEIDLEAQTCKVQQR